MKKLLLPVWTKSYCLCQEKVQTDTADDLNRNIQLWPNLNIQFYSITCNGGKWTFFKNLSSPKHHLSTFTGMQKYTNPWIINFTHKNQNKAPFGNNRSDAHFHADHFTYLHPGSAGVRSVPVARPIYIYGGIFYARSPWRRFPVEYDAWMIITSSPLLQSGSSWTRLIWEWERSLTALRIEKPLLNLL